jgi:hypothetical protein
MQVADKRSLLSREHFSVDGTLAQARASHKTFVPKDGSNDDANSGGPSGRNTPKPTGRANGAATPPAPAPPTHMRDCPGRATTLRRSWT